MDYGLRQGDYATTTEVLRSIVTTGVAIYFLCIMGQEIYEVLYSLRWVFVLMVLLIVSDFVTGLWASVKVKRERFRKSRALRRTMVKFCEYTGFIIIIAALSKSTLEPWGIATTLQAGGVAAMMALFCEADSIYGHVCDLNGWKNSFSIKKIIISYLKHKYKDIGQAADEAGKK